MEKNLYKIGDKIQKNDIVEVSKGIARKAIKVIASNGDIIAIELLEGKHTELYEDIIQEVTIQLLLSNYVITKEAFRIVRKYIYHKNRETIELIINEENENIIENQAYINFINSYGEEERTNAINMSIILEGFTERQKEIINIYSKVNSMQGTANILGVSKGTVNNTIRRLREKIEYKKYELKTA